MYAYLGLLAIALAILLQVLPGGGRVGGRFPVFGFPSLLLGLVLLVATVRLETERGFRLILLSVLGAVGAIEILAAIGIGLFTHIAFLPGEGGIHLVFGLLFVGAYIGLQDRDDLAYYAGLGLGATGLVAIIGGVTRWLLPESIFLVPSGIILISAGVVYVAVAAGICLDWPLVVMTRRELSAYFYSPVAYLVLIGILAVGWFMFWQFVGDLAESSVNPRRGPMMEPVIAQYIFSLIPVIVQMFVVPAITMRLLSEEQRTGTLEVLLTAPVSEWTVVLSKFLAGWIFFLLTWVPWWLFLVALAMPTLGNTEFDYLPLLSFNLVLLAVSAGFISMGLFFSSLTHNQIIAAVLTFVGMIAYLAAYLMKFQLELSPGSVWFEVLSYISYLDLWLNALRGIFTPRYLVFHLSVTVFFLYATTKVLEARKWK